ncbi:unnamed protein product [Sphenostylis stenocarpa]|uniref:Uncharacterized protein n=1 Tax=Sphenostylis stenocarpa TaxID=92480 RepID=A0AA87BA96_9FABA|nr:unnamed protein product [Sphenostylis stenocarpa]
MAGTGMEVPHCGATNETLDELVGQDHVFKDPKGLEMRKGLRPKKTNSTEELLMGKAEAENTGHEGTLDKHEVTNWFMKNRAKEHTILKAYENLE